MSNTEKRALWVTVVILILSSAYYMLVVYPNQQNEFSDQKDKNIKQDGDVNEAVELWDRLDLRLKGTSKHVQTLQDSTRIHYKTYDARVDSIDNAFDKMGFKIEQLEETFTIRIENVKSDIESVKEELAGLKRTTSSKFINITKSVQRLEKAIENLENKWKEEFGDD